MAFAYKANGRNRILKLVSVAVQCVLAATVSEKIRAFSFTPSLWQILEISRCRVGLQTEHDLWLELWGSRCRAVVDIEDLASKLYRRRAGGNFACRDSSDHGTAPEHRNAECESC